jgi:hypothetical protein
MITIPSVQLTINFSDPSLEADERDEEVRLLIADLREIEDVNVVERVVDPNPPEGNKSLGGFLVGLLTAEVNINNAKRLLSFLGNRLSGKTIEMEVEVNGKKLKVKASSQVELVAAIQAAKDFITMT